MQVVQLDRHDGGPASGGAMDRPVEKRRLDRRLLIAIVMGLSALVGVLWWQFAPRVGSQSITADRATISEVTSGVFEDFLPLRAQVKPLVTVYLDAVEGGRIEQLFAEDGASVVKGQLLARLSNAELQLSTLARQTEVEQQLNNMRSQEFTLEQSRMANRRGIIEAELELAKAQRQHDVQAPLAARGFVAGRVFRDSEDNLKAQRARTSLLKDAAAAEERLQASQLRQLRAASASLQSSLGIARGSLDALNLRAPVAGQLSAFSIEIGQSMEPGARLGQIDSPGRNKLTAAVDEFYLGRIEPGQAATITVGGKEHLLKVARILPQVTGGQFRIDLVFVGAEPQGLQRGQTLQARLKLGDPERAKLLPNGSFYNDTGGNWVFVVDPDGTSAERRPVRLGRRNSDFIEVLDGLDTGEKVLTSPYTGLVDKTALTIAPKEND
ncbi:ABC transporter permease [Polymorphobacter glacialis]|uniref:ABC transporter permease n=1 Tax=Sandarakinorhabdus glacialis TaxID=1614636 RepID=A0A916ZJ35_9SPHN|nr:efflux RND transporter periplasmic adaptor subunit [Polymorphobacter glacialis]GGE00399.1 ABC transporter permease [Polymorphobacter glacialis]